jgi:hypothetical protein
MAADKRRGSLEKFETSSVNAATIELGISEPENALQRFCNRLDAVCGVEARGIERIPEEIRERDMTYRDYIHMFTMSVAWWGTNEMVLTCNQLVFDELHRESTHPRCARPSQLRTWSHGLDTVSSTIHSNLVANNC